MWIYNNFKRQSYEWPMITGNNSNTYSTQETLPANLIQKNNIIINTSTDLVVSNGTIYVTDKTVINKLYAFDLATNAMKWQYTVEGQPYAIISLIATGNMIFLLIAKASLHWKTPAAAQLYDGQRMAIFLHSTIMTINFIMLPPEVMQYLQ